MLWRNCQVLKKFSCYIIKKINLKKKTNMEKCANGDPDCKSFKVLGSGIMFEGGSYKAQTVSKAAKRAGVKLFQKVDNDSTYKKFSSKKSIKFILGETTRGSEKKTNAFEVKRVKLDKPKVISRGKIEYTVKYTYECVKLSDQDNEVGKLINEIDNRVAEKKQFKKEGKKQLPLKRKSLAPKRLIDGN